MISKVTISLPALWQRLTLSIALPKTLCIKYIIFAECSSERKELTTQQTTSIGHFVHIPSKFGRKQQRNTGRMLSTRRNVRPQSQESGRSMTAYKHQLSDESRSYTAKLRKQNQSDLFSIDKLLSMFTSALDAQLCSWYTTTVQQIYVVMSIVKHTYDIK